MPCVSSNSPPFRTDGMSGHSPECTHRTGRASCASPARSSGIPSRTAGRASASATVKGGSPTGRRYQCVASIRNLGDESSLADRGAGLDSAGMADVIVIGGGIVGCTAALFAAEAGADVLLLESDTIAAAASGRNAGSIQHPLDEARAQLYEESVAIHRRYGTIYERPAGFLAVGTESAAAVAYEAAARFPALGAEIVRGAELRRLEPQLADGLTGCLLDGTG